LGTAGYFVYRDGANKLDDINSSKSRGVAYNPADRNWETLADLGIGMMIGGAVAVGAGGWLYWWGHNQTPKPTDTSATNVAVGPTADGWRLQISGTF
jgi:hypothetical protein